MGALPVAPMYISDMESLYMIRAFGSGTDFAPQLVLCLLAVGLAAVDVTRRRRWDYVWVLLVSAAVWTTVEVVAQLAGVRVIPERTLFGLALPLPLSVVVQGTGESAGFAVLAVFLGDRLLEPANRRWAMAGVVLACAAFSLPILVKAMLEPEVVRVVTSRRDMFAPAAFLLFSVLLTIDVAFLLRWPAERTRAIAMTLVLIAIGTSWNLAEVVSGGRWIEVAATTSGAFEPAPVLLQLVGFAFDVTVEFALAYLAFLALPTMLGGIDAAAT